MVDIAGARIGASAVRSGRTSAAHLGGAALLLVAVYVLFALTWSDLLVHDTMKYVNQLRSGKFHWDVAHLWAQPLSLLWYRLIGGFTGELLSLKLLNTAAVSLGVVMLYRMLLHTGLGLGGRLLLVAFTMLSFSYLALGPTGHPKMLTLPFLALALLALIGLASALRSVPPYQALRKYLWLGGGSLSVAGAFLASSITVLPYACLGVWLAIGWAARRPKEATRAVVEYAVAAGIVGLVCLLGSYAAAAKAPMSPNGFLEFLFGGIGEKHGLHPGFFGFVDAALRLPYAFVNNLVMVFDLGPLVRGWRFGVLTDIQPFLFEIARDTAVLVLVGVFTAAVLIRSLVRLVRERCAITLFCFCFIAGQVTFAAYHNINDPEHIYQFTIPFTVLLALSLNNRLWYAATGAVLACMVVINVGNYVIPRSIYPKESVEQTLAARFGPSDLLVFPIGYAIRPQMASLDTGDIGTYALDKRYRELRDNELLYREMTARIRAALASDGQVFFFRLFDEQDIQSPWMKVMLLGFDRSGIIARLRRDFRVSGAQDVVGFTAWRVTANE